MSHRIYFSEETNAYASFLSREFVGTNYFKPVLLAFIEKEIHVIIIGIISAIQNFSGFLLFVLERTGLCSSFWYKWTNITSSLTI
jgi:hypothetical protein